MSHFTKLAKANIVDANAYIAAAKELGFSEIKRDAELRGYMGNTQKADVVASLTGCRYDVGIVKNGSRFDLVADWWGVRGSLSNAENRFVQMTTKHTIIATYARQGFMARVANKGGNVVVTLSR